MEGERGFGIIIITKLTCFPAFGRLAAVECEDTRSHQDVIQALEPTCLFAQLLAAFIRHHIDLPHEDVGLRLEGCWVCGLNVRLDACAVLNIDKNKSLDFTVGKELRSSRAKCSIGACNQDRLAFVRFGVDCELGVSLLPEIPPGEDLCDEEWYCEGDDDNSESCGDNWPVFNGRLEYWRLHLVRIVNGARYYSVAALMLDAYKSYFPRLKCQVPH